MSVVVPDGTTIAKGAGWRQFRTSPGCSSCSKRFESGVEMVPPPGDGTHHLSQLEIDAAAGGNRGRTEIGTDFGEIGIERVRVATPTPTPTPSTSTTPTPSTSTSTSTQRAEATLGGLSG